MMKAGSGLDLTEETYDTDVKRGLAEEVIIHVAGATATTRIARVERRPLNITRNIFSTGEESCDGVDDTELGVVRTSVGQASAALHCIKG